MNALRRLLGGTLAVCVRIRTCVNTYRKSQRRRRGRPLDTAFLLVVHSCSAKGYVQVTQKQMFLRHSCASIPGGEGCAHRPRRFSRYEETATGTVYIRRAFGWLLLLHTHTRGGPLVKKTKYKKKIKNLPK